MLIRSYKFTREIMVAIMAFFLVGQMQASSLHTNIIDNNEPLSRFMLKDLDVDCNISLSFVSFGTCEDMNTIDPSDDQQNFIVRAILLNGTSTSFNLEINGDVVGYNVSYNTDYPLSYSSGSTFYVTARDPLDPTCCNTISVTTQAPCSVPCSINASFVQGVCNAGTQTIPVTVNILGSAGRAWQIVLIDWFGAESVVSTGTGNLTRNISIPYSATAGAPMNYFGASLRVEWVDKTPCSISWTNGPCGGVFPPPTGSCTGAATITGNSTLCYASTIGLTAIMSGGVSPFSYIWSNGEHTQTANVPNVPAGTYTVTVVGSNYCRYTASTIVTTKANAFPGIQGATNLCFGQSTTLTTAQAHTAYKWSTGPTTRTISISAPGTYTVTVTNANGCTASTKITVTQLTDWGANIGYLWGNYGTSIGYGPCPGLSFSVVAGVSNNVTGPLTYKWNTGATAQKIVGAIGTTYTVTVTSGVGCVETSTMTAINSPAANVSLTAPQNYFCNKDFTTPIRIDAITNGTTYAWSSGVSCCPHVDVNTTGTYSVTVTTDEGCKSTSSFTIANYDVNVTLTGGDICTSGLKKRTTNLIATSNAPNNKSFAWSNGFNSTGLNSTNVVATTGVYSVVASYLGCTDNASITINALTPVPAFEIVAPPLACGSTNITMTAAPTLPSYTYVWSTGSLSSNVPQTVNSTRTYSLTMTNSFGCASADSHTIVYSPNITVAITGNRTVCGGSENTLTVPSGFATYSWTDLFGTELSNTRVYPYAYPQNTYTVEVTNSAGCTSSSSIYLTPYPYSGNTDMGNIIICARTPTVIYPLPIPTIQSVLWSNGATTTSITVSTAGTYIASITDTYGCKFWNSMNLDTIPSPVATIAGNGYLTPCASSVSLSSSTATAYKWNTNSTTQAVSVSTAGVYTVTVTGSNGCTATKTTTVDFKQGTIGNFVWYDDNKNGLQDEAASRGINGISVGLYKAGPDGLRNTADDILVGTTVTNNNIITGNPGFYEFTICSGQKFFVKFPSMISGTDLSLTTATPTYGTNGNSDPDKLLGITPLFDMDITVSGGGLLQDNPTLDAGYWGLSLPIELKSFSGIGKDCKIYLNWVTSSEKYNDYFIIEKSVDGGKSFYEIARYKGKLNSTVETEYQFIDENVNQNGYVYRLSQRDLDGTLSVFGSKYIGANCKKFDQEGISLVYPNPTFGKSTLTVHFNATESGDYQVQIIGITGQSMMSQKVNLETGNNILKVPTDNLPSGTYILKMMSLENVNSFNRLIVISE